MSKREAPKGCYWRGGVLWGRITVRGQEIRWSLRTGDAAVALRRVAQRRDEELGRAHFGEHRPTYEEAFAAWASDVAAQIAPSTARRYAVSLGQLAPWLTGRNLDEIDTALMGDIVRERRKAGAGTATIRRDLTALSRVLEFTIDEGWRDDNPALARLRRLRERRDPIVLPEPADIEYVIGRAPGQLATLIEAAWRTGARQAELVEAERRQVDQPRRQMRLKGKGNKVRVIDLDPPHLPPASGLFARNPAAIGSKWLFWHGTGDPYRNVASRFALMVRSAQKSAQREGREFRPFRFHDLRHRHAVDWLKAGGSLYDLQQRLGHASIKTTEIYLAFLTPDEARIAKHAAAQIPARVERSRSENDR